MAGSVCPQCGAILAGDRMRFCAQCGCDLHGAVVVETQSLASPTPSDGQCARGGVGSAHTAGPRGKTPAADNVVEAALKGPEQRTAKAKVSKAARAGRSQEPAKGSGSRGLALSINTNQFCMQGFRTVLDIKVENLSDHPFESIEVEAAGDLLGRVGRWSGALAPCEEQRRGFGFKPEEAGVERIAFKIDLQQGEAVYSYEAETDLVVFERTSRVNDIKIQADRFISVGGATGGSKDMAHAVNVNIENLIKQEKIHDANDLMREYRKLPPDFEMLPLTYDPRRSQELTESLRKKQGKRIVEAARGSAAEVASLLMKDKGRPVHVMLLAKRRVTLGKNRRNDIVARICPRSREHDSQSNQISRDHCSLELTESGVLVKDTGSINGTYLNSQRLDVNGTPIDSASELDLGGVLKLKVTAFSRPGKGGDAGYEALAPDGPGPLWKTAGGHVDAIVLDRVGNLGREDETGCERYCLLYRLATIGSDRDCTWHVNDKGLEPLHAAIVYLRDRFYLDNVSGRTDVSVNGRTLLKNELIPLTFGDHIHLGHLEMEFATRSHLFVD